MTYYGYLFSMNLHAKLKEKIVGRIFVNVTYKDELYIKIESFGDLKYEYSVSNFTEKLVNGLTSDYIAYDVTKRYKEFIVGRYFK